MFPDTWHWHASTFKHKEGTTLIYTTGLFRSRPKNSMWIKTKTQNLNSIFSTKTLKNTAIWTFLPLKVFWYWKVHCRACPWICKWKLDMKIHIASYLVIRMSAPLATQGTHTGHTEPKGGSAWPRSRWGVCGPRPSRSEPPPPFACNATCLFVPPTLLEQHAEQCER